MYWRTAEGQALIATTQALAYSGPEGTSLDSARLALLAARKIKAPAELIRQAVEIVTARKLARSKCGAWAAGGLFYRVNVEQATRPLIAQHHAKVFSHSRHVLELGTGLGMDTAALAAVCERVTSIEQNHETAEMARYNLELRGISNVTVLTGNAQTLCTPELLSTCDGLWADPARRTAAGKRIHDAEQYTPPLSLVQSVSSTLPTARCGIKVAPGLRLETIAPGWKSEFIGFADECLEQIMWRVEHETLPTVTLVDTEFSWEPSSTADSGSSPALPGAEPKILSPLPPQFILVEPHAALIASEKLSAFYYEQGINVLDRSIAYGIVTAAYTPHPLLTAFKVFEWFPFSIRQLKERLGALAWSNATEIKKRGFAEAPEQIRKLVNLPSSSPTAGVVLLTRASGRPICLLATRY